MRTLSFLMFSLAAGVAFGAEVYRSVDANGVVTYSDRPNGEVQERVVIATATPTPPPAQATTDAASDQGAAGAADGVLAETGPTPEEVAEQRVRNCEIATERAERYRVSRRLYRESPDGEREYLSDDEIDAAKADAEADVVDWCS